MKEGEAKALTEKLSLEEKVHLCTGKTYWSTYPIERIGLKECILADGPHGVRKVKEKDHLGQTVNERATGFPVSAAMGATWNKELLYEMGCRLGEECQAIGVDLLLGPAVNMKRSVLGGRNFEYLSEDPVLAGKLAAQIVKGIQSTGTGACVKHFACNNSESYRMTADVIVDERTLRELYLKVFEIIVKEADPAAVMGAYNKVNGVYACENKQLLTEILRKEWGFKGIVVSDWLAVDECVNAVTAGLNLEMPSNPAVCRKLMEAVRDGRLDEAVLNKRTEELLTVLLQLQKNRNSKPICWEKHRETACEIAVQSMVLLKNEGGLLPIHPKETESVALIGDFAVHPRIQGGGSSRVETGAENNILTELCRLGNTIEFTYAQGYEPDGTTTEDLLEEAKQVAARCGKVVIFAGLPESYESEGYDRIHMKMPEGQLRLIDEIAALRSDVAVVLSNGSAVELPFLEKVDAVLETWLLGQEAAEAIAKVLLGVRQPSGRMPETFPVSLEEESAAFLFGTDEKKLFYGERMMTGYRYYDKKQMTPAAAFGEGLSYGVFEYTGGRVSGEMVTDCGELQVYINVKNVGTHAGYEVVQLYVSNYGKERLHPEKELKDFCKLYLKPGEERTVSFCLGKDAFQCYSEQKSCWVVENGIYEILIGASSRDIRFRQKVTACEENNIPDTLTKKSTLEQWLFVKEGQEEAEKMLQRYRGFGMRDDKGFQELSHFVQQIMLEMPMTRLVTASNGSFTEEELDQMVVRIREKEAGE